MSKEKDKNKQGNVFDFGLLKRIIHLTDPYKTTFYGAIVLSLTLAALSPIRPLLVQTTIDKYISHFDKTGLMYMCAYMFLFLMTESFLRYFFNYVTGLIGQSIVKDLRMKTFSHIIQSRLKYFDTTPIGTSTTRTINDIETINDVFGDGLINIIADFSTIAVLLGVMFWKNWQMALASISTLPFLFFITYWFKEGVKKSFQDVRTQVAKMNAFLNEHITGMKIIQLFNVEEKEYRKFVAINEAHKTANIQGIWYYSLFFPAVEILLAVAIGMMVWMASRMIVGGTLPDVGVISAYILFINMLFRPLRFIADRINTLQMGMIASERVFKLIDREEAIPDTGTHISETMEGKIQFDKVWFAYNNDDYVLKNLSFTVEAGETLAIVGATGSGKTSTISLLGRFYEINKGAIRVDDINIADYKLNALRSHTSIVLQDVFLFAGTVYENITLRNAALTKEQAIAAAKEVGAHEFIMRLPGGYDYKVMERGATLSMGQRQLISFARALVFDPSILILDEATSSIDSESEAIVQQAIEKLVKGRTSIVIAHRLSTIRHAHKIMVLDKGELKEFGTHDQLLELDNGFYKHLYEMQFVQREVA